MTIPRPAAAPRGAPVFVHHGCLHARACDLVRAAIDGAPQSPAEIFRDGYRVDEAVRRSHEVEADAATIHRVEQAIMALEPALSRHFAVPVSGFEGVGLLRYRAGGFYRRHRDVLHAASGFARRRISIVLFLTGSTADESSAGAGLCAGGALRVYAGEDDESYTDILPRAGTLVAFPATLLHEVRPVIAGVRDVAVDWTY